MTDKQYPIKSNEQKKKELFRYLFVFLTIYFKYFKGEFWWTEGLRSFKLERNVMLEQAGE